MAGVGCTWARVSHIAQYANCSTSLLRSAIPLSIALHRAIVRQGTVVLEKQAIKTLRSFRLAVIREGPDLAAFIHPATLIRLGQWLVDAVRDVIVAGLAAGGRAPKSLPFVIATLDAERDVFCVVGINASVEYGDVKKKYVLSF